MILVLNPSFHPWPHDIEEYGGSYMFLSNSKCTLRTNPFLAGNPNVLEEMQGPALVNAEGWNENADLFPPA